MPLGHKELQTLKGKSKNKMREMWRGEGDMERGGRHGDGKGEGRGEGGEGEMETQWGKEGEN